jgi:nucleotide-binding universal stress UspA family protein
MRITRSELQSYWLKKTMHLLGETTHPVSTTLKSGVVADELLQFVTLQHSGLLDVGSRSRGGLKRFLLGGKTTRIAQLCAIPVLIVRHHDYSINEN